MTQSQPTLEKKANHGGNGLGTGNGWGVLMEPDAQLATFHRVGIFPCSGGSFPTALKSFFSNGHVFEQKLRKIFSAHLPATPSFSIIAIIAIQININIIIIIISSRCQAIITLTLTQRPIWCHKLALSKILHPLWGGASRSSHQAPPPCLPHRQIESADF